MQRNGIVQFDFQQFLFACQARILLKQQRAAEVHPVRSDNKHEALIE